MIKEEKNKISNLTSFLRYNVSAFAATTADYLTFAFGHYVLGIYYPIATFISASCGAITAFLLGRYWAFPNSDGDIQTQGFKFFLTAIGSIILNTAGLAFFVEILNIENKMMAKIITSLAVGFIFNYPMQRFFVYK